MEQTHNLTDRTFIILRKRNFSELTFQEFRAQYATTFNVMKPPERAKLMKLAILKVSYSAKHKKQIMRIFIEKDYLCQCDNELCPKLHCLKPSDRCHLFDSDQTCNHPKCTKLHIPSKSLHSRIIEVFKKCNRLSMPFSKFIVLHRTTYPLLREHHPTNDILSNDEFVDICKIENTEKTKNIRLLRKGRHRLGPPSLSENIDAPYPALKCVSFDHKWRDTNALIKDLLNLFLNRTVKDVFIPGHSRMAFVTFANCSHAEKAVKKLNNTWFCGRKVTVALTAQNCTDYSDDEKKVPSTSAKIVIRAINNVISQQRIREWLDKIGKIETIQTCFGQCRRGSPIAYIHFKSVKIIHEIINAKNKNNKIKNGNVVFRNKAIKLQLIDDGYTDSFAYYSMHKSNDEQKKQSKSIAKHISKLKKHRINKINLTPSLSTPATDLDSKSDSMQLLVMRLKSLIENTKLAQKDLEKKLKIISFIGKNKENKSGIDVDIAFGDESYTIDALTEQIHTLKSDKNQINVYKQALTAFDTAQSRAISKNQREVKPICDKEIKLAKQLQCVHSEIESLEQQLLHKKAEQSRIKSDLEITRNHAKTLRKSIAEMKHKIEPIRTCLKSEKNNSQIPTQTQIEKLESNLQSQSANIAHWLRWKEWDLSAATQWIGGLSNGKFENDLKKFNALSKISQGSILNAITDPTLQIIGIESEKNRKIILSAIALLKSRTAMMRKSLNSYQNRRTKYANGDNRRKSVSNVTFFGDSHSAKHNKPGHSLGKRGHSLDDIDGVRQMIRSTSMQSDGNNDNLCVICMDREIAPYAMVPCGHQSLCIICKNLIKPNKHKCPMCQGKVTMIIKLFRA